MAPSPQRLAELRAMPYEEYRATPEWMAQQKGFLTQESRCLICQGSERLGVYHYTLEHQGAEQDSDLLTLCANCYENTRSTNIPTLPFLGKAGVFAGVAAISTIGLEGFLQAPFPAEVGALIAAYFLAKNSPALYGRLKKHISPEVLAWLGLSKAPNGKRSGLSRWLKTPQLEQAKRPTEVDVDATHIPQGTDQHTNKPAPKPVENGIEQPNQSPNDPAFIAESPIFPFYPNDETVLLGQAIDKQALAKLAAAQQARKPLPFVIGRRFDPHINSLYGMGVIIAAAQGSGKSMLNGLLIEQAGACDSPVIIFDHKGEYAPIAELDYLNGLIVGGEMARKKATKLRAPYFGLTTDNALEFVSNVFAKRQQAIVILPSYGDSWLARAEIVATVGQALMRYAGQQREEEKVILPCLVFLDEAQLYIPQNANLLPPEAQKNKEVLDSLQNAFFALVSNGRSNGYTMCFATQSLTYIAKWAIKSCQIKILMRHVEYNDLNMCEEILGAKGIARREDMETMPPGVGVVFNLTPKPMIVQFDTRESRNESETPGVERLRQASQDRTVDTANTTRVGDLSLDQLIALLGQRSNEVPNTDTLPNPDGPLPLGQEVSISREMFEVAVRMRKNGTSTGFRDLMTTFDLTEHYARRLNKLIDDEIEREIGGS